MLATSSSAHSPANHRKRPAEVDNFERSTKRRNRPHRRMNEPSGFRSKDLRHRWFAVSLDAWQLLCETVTQFLPGRTEYAYRDNTRDSTPSHDPKSLPESPNNSTADRVSGSGARSTASDATMVATSSDVSSDPPYDDSEHLTSTPKQSRATVRQPPRSSVQTPRRPKSNTEMHETPVAGPSSSPQSLGSVNDRMNHLQLEASGSKDRPSSSKPSHRRYQNKKHIFDKAHKTRVQSDRQKDRAELENELYNYQRAAGYQSSLADFKGLLAYKEQVELLEKRGILSPSSSLTDLRNTATPEPSRRHSYSDDVSMGYLHRALNKARETMNGPKPPKPFTPSIEQLQIRVRAKDAEIERKLRPQLPTALPPAEEAEVQRLLQKRGVIGKFAREQVSHDDIARLQPGKWLNDEIINFYGAMILGRSDASKENPGKGAKQPWRTHYFSSFFWPKLIGEGYEKGRLAKWTKKVDIFQKDIIVMPINHSNSHWTAAAINFRKKRIEAYDSLYDTLHRTEDAVFKHLRIYLDAEHRNKKKKPFDFTDWVDYSPEPIPYQENHFDCGVFTCQFMESLSRGEESFAFSQRHMPYLRKRMILEIASGTLRDPP
ncbi:hypothetical protein HGRIS_007618 [Hohenbuehelia grisea]|uniref:Ubiquitin-like protease family profile domain-containing protein n=1 Tax=Hohenbuehelia grisea TaxID=104357 RepID=A0ABR3J5F0_9AGAR